MSVAGAVTSGLRAAMLLARGRSDGLHLVETGMAGAARSFWAMAICLPVVVCLRLMTWLQLGAPAQPVHALSLDLMAYVVGWLGFAVLSYRVVPLLGAAPHWPRFIAAWNWCSVVENLLLVVGSLPGLLHAPPVIDETAQIIATGWALWIEWYAAKLTLGSGGFAAVWLVILDQSIGLLLAGVNISLLGG